MKKMAVESEKNATINTVKLVEGYKENLEDKLEVKRAVYMESDLDQLDEVFKAFLDSDGTKECVEKAWRKLHQQRYCKKTLYCSFTHLDIKYFATIRTRRNYNRGELLIQLNNDGYIYRPLPEKHVRKLDYKRHKHEDWQRLDDGYLLCVPTITAFHVALCKHCPALIYNNKPEVQRFDTKSYLEDESLALMINFEGGDPDRVPDDPDYDIRCTLHHIPN